MDFITNGTFSKTSKVTNDYTGEIFSLAGKRGSSRIFTATAEDTQLVGDSHATNKNDAFIYDLTLSGKNALRFSGFTHFDLGEGDDVLDLTVRPGHEDRAYTLPPRQSVTAYGGSGDDVIFGGGPSYNSNLYGDVETLNSLGGDDTIVASSAQPNRGSTVYGDAAVIQAGGQGGDDLLQVGAAQQSALFGDANIIEAGARGGDDVLYGGSEGGNTMYGDASFLAGEGGDDVIHGGTAGNIIAGDALNAVPGAIGGDDRLYGGDLRDMIFGDASNFYGAGGTDVIDGHGGDDQLYGEGSTVFGVAGNDVISGGSGKDYLIGDGTLREGATGGDDLLDGGEGDDLLIGDGIEVHPGATAGDDTLQGGDGNDQLYGDFLASAEGARSGDDVLEGGAGDDRLWGDGLQRTTGAPGAGSVEGGADIFVFAPGDGADTIEDFGFGGGDRIDLSAWELTDFGDLAISGNGTPVVTITLDADDKVTVCHFDTSLGLSLTASDFIFA